MYLHDPPLIPMSSDAGSDLEKRIPPAFADEGFVHHHSVVVF
jgi:hypothetical protein